MPDPTLLEAQLLLQTYGYLILFPLAVIEGPIITAIAGFLVSLGVFNPLIVYLIVVIGDILGDAFWYSVGRFGADWRLTGWVKRFFKIDSADIETARQMFETHRYKMMSLSKFAWGVGSAGLVAAGLSKVPYLTFATTCLVVSMAQAAFFLGAGVLLGSAYAQIAPYLDIVAAVALALFVLGIAASVWFLVKRRLS